MKTWVDRLLLIALTLFVVLLTLTALPSLFYGHLGGTMLLAHMLVSGAFVFLLPVFALLWTWRHISRFTSGTMQRIGFWAVIFTGFLTIATVFVCMLPYPSTDQMRQLIHWHGYAGFAIVPALALLLWGTLRWRRMEEIRSETLG